MREIKFRAWDKNKNQMITRFDGIAYVGDNGGNTIKPQLMANIEGYHWCVANWGTDVELMQFTGLKDKNGKEIYEGDIVNSHAQFEQPYIREVIWGENCGLVFKPLTGFNLCKPNEYHFEIIGNIYENPELLR